jgi:glutaredoxin-related protein
LQVPRVFVGGKCIGGGTEVMRLSGQKKLVSVLQEANATFKDTKKDS